MSHRAAVNAYLARLRAQDEQAYQEWAAAKPSPVVRRLRALRAQQAGRKPFHGGWIGWSGCRFSVIMMIEDYTPEEFEAVLNAFVEREIEDVPVDDFFAALAEIDHCHRQESFYD